MLIFYADETGNSSLATVEGSDPAELKPGTTNFFTLAAVGIRDSSRKPLAQSLLRLKREHFGDEVDGDWGDTEIKGRYLLHMTKYAGNGRQTNTPPGWGAVATPIAVAALVGDIAKIFRTSRPLILTTVVDKRKMLARQRQPLNPIGIVYAYLQRNIALTLEHQHAGEAAVVVADQQGQHESFFRSGGIHEIRSELSAAHLRQPNYNLVLDKPLWVDTDLSIWDRELIQLADIVSFMVTRLMEDGEPPAELEHLWEALLPQFALHPESGRVLGRGISMYPPRSSRLTL